MAARKSRAKQPQIAKTVEAALRGVRSVIATAKKKPKKQTPAQELRSIERLLGEDFDSLAQAKAALRRETQTITPKAAKAFKARQQRERVSFDVPELERGRRAAPEGSAGPSREPAPPAAPAAPALYPGQPLNTLPGLEGLTMGQALRAIDRDPGKYDAMLAPNQQIAVKIHGNAIEREFASFRQMTSELRVKYPRKGMTAQQTQAMWNGMTITVVGQGGVDPVIYKAQIRREQNVRAAAKREKQKQEREQRAAEKTERIAKQKAAEKKAKKATTEKRSVERELKRERERRVQSEAREKKLRAELKKATKGTKKK